MSAPALRQPVCVCGLSSMCFVQQGKAGGPASPLPTRLILPNQELQPVATVGVRLPTCPGDSWQGENSRAW